MIIQTRFEGAPVPTGLSVTRSESGRCAYCLRVGNLFKISMSLAGSAGRSVFSVETATRKDPEYPGVLISVPLIEVTV